MRPLALLTLLAAACSPGFELPTATPGRELTVAVEPVGSIEAAPAVFRLRVAGGAGRSALADFRFFSGSLGAYHLGRIEKRELPATLLEREIAVLAWVEERDVVVAPLRALANGNYALATPELGLVGDVVVDATLVPVVERAWPPRDATAGAGTAIFCGDAARAVAPGSVELAPTGAPATVARGLDADETFSDACVRLEPSAAPASGIPLLPPALAGGAAFEPLLLVATADVSQAQPCTPPELALGPACGSVADDRLELHSTGAPAFVAFEAPSTLLGVVAPGSSLVLRGFSPSSVTWVRGVAFDIAGERSAIELELRTAPAREHLVLNEVLANPAGPEASSEWIELVNDGPGSLNLRDFVLDDGIEPVALPAHELAPGAFALLVADGYAPDPELDVVPAPGLTLVTLPRLGRSGLANSGELLRLRDRDGNVVSRFPAVAAPGPGRSLARRALDALDGESASFAPHAAPGASPGGANVVEAD